MRRIAAQLFARLSAERRVFFTMPNSYEMFGLDFVVDRSGTVWLVSSNAATRRALRDY